MLISSQEAPVVVTVKEETLCEDLAKQLSAISTTNFLKKDGLLIQLGNSKLTLDSLADKVITEAVKKQILVKIDQSYVINRNKFS